MNERRLQGAGKKHFERGHPAQLAAQRTRLAEIVAYARAHSRYYRELYEQLPERVEDTALLRATKKKDLMACFDDWVTDREVTLNKVSAFIVKRDLIDERFLGKS